MMPPCRLLIPGKCLMRVDNAGASGAAARVTASLAEDRKSWGVSLPWFEAGKHQVSLYVDGTQVMLLSNPMYPLV